MRRSTRTWVVWGLGLLFLGWHASRFLPFMADDAFISLRYADQFLAGEGLVWNPGERVEGYSNLLWVLGCALGGALGLDLVHAARGLGALCSGATLAALAWTYRERPLSGLVGVVAIASASPVAVWTVGGMEQPLLAALLAWALALALDGGSRRALGCGLLLGLAVLCRADALVFALALALAWGWSTRREPGLRWVPVLALPLVFCGAQFLFRRFYYGEWWPNSAWAKLAFTSHRFEEGLAWWAGGCGVLLPLFLLGALGVARSPRRWIVFPFLAGSAWVVVIGGDIFPGWRHWVPLVVFLAFLAAEAVRAMQKGEVLALGAVVLLVGSVPLQHANEEVHRAKEERWEWHGEVVGELLRTAFGEKEALLAVTAAGCLPFFSGLPAIDMLGMNDHYLAHNRPLDFGHGQLGHELGEGEYLLNREPDLVIFCGPDGGDKACFPSGWQMEADSRFAARYRLVDMVGEEPYEYRSRVWVKTESPRIGVVREPGRIRVPGFFFAQTPGSEARLDEAGILGLVLEREEAVFEGLVVPPGRWRAHAIAGDARLEVSVAIESGKARLSIPADGQRRVVTAVVLELESISP